MKKEQKLWAFWIGMAIVVLSHIYMLIAGLPANQAVPHAIVNLVGAGLFAYAWFG